MLREIAKTVYLTTSVDFPCGNEIYPGSLEPKAWACLAAIGRATCLAVIGRANRLFCPARCEKIHEELSL
jgi:hypothetical protein